jgi:FemAB family protein
MMQFILPDFTPLEDQGFTFKLYDESDYSTWQHVLQNCKYQPVVYLRGLLNYYIEYYEGNDLETKDFSIIISHQGEQIAIWPFMIRVKLENVYELVSGGSYLIQPLVVHMAGETIRIKIEKIAFLIAKEFAAKNNVTEWLTESIFQNQFGLSQWDKLSTESAHKIDTKFSWFHNLSNEDQSIKSQLRKGSRSSVQAGIDYWLTSTMDTNNIDKNIWSEFENLHLKVSGRKTRSQKTWDLQLEQIVNGEAILVYGRDPKNFILIGAALFVHTKHESLYAVAAYVRDELPMPISHAIQYVAMEYMKNNGVYWHKIGEALLNEMPMVALASAGASLIPSPTIAIH